MNSLTGATGAAARAVILGVNYTYIFHPTFIVWVIPQSLTRSESIEDKNGRIYPIQSHDQASPRARIPERKLALPSLQQRERTGENRATGARSERTW